MNVPTTCYFQKSHMELSFHPKGKRVAWSKEEELVLTNQNSPSLDHMLSQTSTLPPMARQLIREREMQIKQGVQTHVFILKGSNLFLTLLHRGKKSWHYVPLLSKISKQTLGFIKIGITLVSIFGCWIDEIFLWQINNNRKITLWKF